MSIIFHIRRTYIIISYRLLTRAQTETAECLLQKYNFFHTAYGGGTANHNMFGMRYRRLPTFPPHHISIEHQHTRSTHHRDISLTVYAYLHIYGLKAFNGAAQSYHTVFTRVYTCIFIALHEHTSISP